MMRSVPHIKNLIAGLLLCAFTLASAPKVFLHYLFARHGDQKSIANSPGKLTLSTSGFNCKCDDQVCQSVFIKGLEQRSNNNIIYGITFHVLLDFQLIKSPSSFRSDRAPPQLI